MNNLTELKETLLGRLGGDEIVALSRATDTLMLYRLVFDSDPVVARKAAWALTHKSDADIALLPQQELVDLALSTDNVSLRRLSLSLIERQPLKESDLRSDFLDFCLAGMVSLEQPSGVQALCMKLAFRMCSFYPELLHEFTETLNLMHVDYYKPGLKSLIKKLKKQLS